MVIGWGAKPDRVHRIYNALPLSDLPTLISPAEARQKLGLPDAPLLLTAARLMPWKGVDHLIAALYDLPDVHLIVAGAGSMLKPLRIAVEALGMAGRVHFLGQVPRETLALYFRAVDYTALYSGYEGLSHVLLESLRAGTPVIASDKGGNPEVVQPNVNGWLGPYVDADALQTTLKLAFEPGVRDRLAAGTGSGLEHFAFDGMAEQTAAVLAAQLKA
jgi:glycosyltransferase involved in cell wall biosynthesis